MFTELGRIKRLQEIIKDCKSQGILVRGQKELIAFCEGESLSARQSILAHCYQCLGYYQGMEGERDCQNPVCPLYPFMPYSTRKAKRRGSPISEEHKEKMRRGRAFKGATDNK